MIDGCDDDETWAEGPHDHVEVLVAGDRVRLLNRGSDFDYANLPGTLVKCCATGLATVSVQPYPPQPARTKEWPLEFLKRIGKPKPANDEASTVAPAADAE